MIYDLIRELTKVKGLSIAEVERKADLGNGTIAKWQTASPRLDSLYRVAKALNVPITTFLEDGNED